MKSPLLDTSHLPSDKDIEDNEDLAIILGSLQLRNQSGKVENLLEAVKENILKAISSPDIVRQLIISQHPKFLLEYFSKKHEHNLRLVSYIMQSGQFEAKIYFEEEKMFTSENNQQAEAERCVAMQLLDKLYKDEMESLNIYSFDFPLEEEVIIGLGPNKKRVIEMTKSSNETFGFTIRGGEQKVIRNREYIQFHTITPICISSIQEGSPAETCNLKVGDIILAVNDYALKNLSHSEAVRTLKKFIDAESITFTVKHDKNELLKHEAEKDLLSRQTNRISQEMSVERLKKWHMAKAKLNPEQYLVGKVENKKREFQPKNSRKAIRLWEYRDYKK